MYDEVASALKAGDLPPWLSKVEDDPTYGWAVRAWRRATEYPDAWFDARKTDIIVAAWPRIFRLTNDRFAGKPFQLLAWQEIIVRLLVGWKRPAEVIDPETHHPSTVHVRLFRRLDLWIPRKNGKSEFLAALGILFWAMENLAGAEGYVFARNEEQGAIAFSKMRAMLEAAPALTQFPDGTQRITWSKRNIYVRSNKSLLTLLTGRPDGKHGRSPQMILGDEIHEWTTREVADTLRQGTGARLQPMELYASTAGQKSGLVGYEWFEESDAIAKGQKDDPTTLAAVFAIGEDDDWTDEKIWRRANPSLGLTPTWDFIRAEFTRARGRPVDEARFKAYHLNQWVDSVSGWIPRARWRACTVDATVWPKAYDRNRGRRCFAAIDVSATRDLTALVLMFPPDDNESRWAIVPLFWIPEATLEERAADDRRVDWRRWVKTGALRTTPGDVVDQSFVEQAVLDAGRDFDLAELGYDPWNATKLMTDLQADGMEAERQILMRQGTPTLGEPTKHFELKVFAGEIEHYGHPVLAWMVGHAQVRFDKNLNYTPSKGDSRDKIDGVVAAVMALALAERSEEDSDPMLIIG